MGVKPLVVIGVVAFVLVLSAGGLRLSTGVGGHIDGPALVAGGSQNTRFGARLEGVLEIRDHCLVVSGTTVVWPAGTRWSDGRLQIGGETFAVGDRVVTGGGQLEARSVERMFGGAVAAAAESCGGGGGAFAVQHEVRPAE